MYTHKRVSIISFEFSHTLERARSPSRTADRRVKKTRLVSVSACASCSCCPPRPSPSRSAPKGSSNYIIYIFTLLRSWLLLFSFRVPRPCPHLILCSVYSCYVAAPHVVVCRPALSHCCCSHLRSRPHRPFIFSSISICGLWQRCDGDGVGGGSRQGNTWRSIVLVAYTQTEKYTLARLVFFFFF